MPYLHIYKEPEVAYISKDNKGEEVVIYKTYAEQDYDYPFTFWFSLNKEEVEEDEFDIRDFKGYDEDLSINENFDFLTMKGYITSEGWRYDLNDEL